MLLKSPKSTDKCDLIPQSLLKGSLIPTYSSGSQNTTSRSPVAIMLYRGFHSHTATRPLHGSCAIGLNNLRSPSSTTVPCVSHTTASLSAPDPPTKKRPSALKHTSPCPRGPPGDPGAARECLNGVLAGG